MRRAPVFRRLSRLLFGLAVGAALAASLWHPGDSSGFWGGIEGRFVDARFALRGPLPAPDGVAILALTDSDINRLGQFPPPRSAIADAVDAATAGGALAVALDLLLVQTTPQDSALIAALARNGRSVLAIAASNTPQAQGRSDALQRSGFDIIIGAPDVVQGHAMLGPSEQLASPATFGHVNVITDTDGALRRLLAVAPFGPERDVILVPNLAIAALRQTNAGAPLELHLGASGMVKGAGHTLLLDRGGAIPLVYYGAAGTIPTWPLAEAGTADLAGRIVFVGATAQGIGDRHVTPFDPNFAGVEAYATLAANAIEGRTLRRDPVAWMADIVIALIAAWAAFAAASIERPVLAALVATGVILSAAAFLQGAFVAGWWLDGATLLMALAAGLAGGSTLRLLHHRRRAANLRQYQSPILADMLAMEPHPTFDRRAQEAAVLFVDVVASTARVEAVGPSGAADFMAEFHRRVERMATRHGGMVEQFAGDGAMVIFGLPQPRPGDAEAALSCMAALRGAMKESKPPIEVRMSAHYGPVQAGVLGGDAHRHVTVTGAVVHAANRLQDFARDTGAVIAVSQDLLNGSADGQGWIQRLNLADRATQSLRGLSVPVHIWAAT
ncbi:adenylate/guanylate cyclase domain-containing protein [Roseovarius sp. Pro17]|uniref:CHASE2 domain-containing protein n=1 Tax=Roseovarius sp. Pro17 TaxID=3108175 RepID=UPI002D7833A6|nr:adenylate/guanylate cyclase domain-containing protein [Roseovarius sp. Pro17]